MEEIISAIGLVGLGGLLKSFFDFFIDSKKVKSETNHQFKETRYKAIIILSYALVGYDTEKNRIFALRPDIRTREDLFDEVYLEWVNMTLYASDKVILKMKYFLEDVNQNNFNETILAMRKDLYGIRTKLQKENLNIAASSWTESNNS